ncbi:hypothetical protein [Fodinibius roseus]|nr:hypothetical protein [Fodinibius roseus]
MRNTIKQHIQQVENRIIQACRRVGRDPPDPYYWPGINSASYSPSRLSE